MTSSPSALTQAAAWGLWALVGLPALVGALLLVVRPRRGAAVAGASVATATLVLLVSVGVALTRPAVGVPFVAGAELGLRVDGLAAVVAPTVAVVALLALIAGAVDVRHAPARFHGLMLVFTAAALLTVTATTLPTLLLAWEVMGATSYALIGFEWAQPHNVASGLWAFLTTRTADLGLYVAAAAALAAGSGLRLDALAGGTPGWRDVVALGVLVAAFGKAAQLVLAFWLSRAMDGPSPVSALLHSAAMVALGGFLLLRLQPLLAATGWAAGTAAWVGAATTVVLGLVALTQRDLKQLLAASTSAQLGYVVLAAGVGATTAGTAHLVAHAATKAGLFLAAGAWLSALGSRQLAALRGRVATWRLLRVAASVGLLSLAGLPPLGLWASKDLVLAAALQRSVLLYAVGLVGAALSAAYAGAVLRVLWAPADADDERRADRLRGTEEEARAVVPAALTATVVVLAALAVLLGLVALSAVAEALGRVVGGPGAQVIEPARPEIVLSTVLTLGGLALAWRRPGWFPAATPARDRPTGLGRPASWYGLEDVVVRVVVRPVLSFADGAARLDNRFADALLGSGLRTASVARALSRIDERWAAAGAGSGPRTVDLAGRAARTDDRVVAGAVLGLAGRMRRLGALARRPQTGQLHQYYVQAVALIAVGAVLLVVMR